MADRIAEIRDGIQAKLNRVPDSDAVLLDKADVQALLARLSAVTDALDREKLAKDLHERFASDWMAHWDDLDETERQATEAWDIADAVRRHVLGEEQN